MNPTGLQRSRSAQKSVLACAGAARRALLAFAVLLFAAPALAQTNALADRLPADTWAYISWGGTASLKPVSATNPVLRLWNDPSFSVFMQRAIFNISHQEGPAQKFGGLTPEQTAEIFSALENPAVIGFVDNRENSRAAGEGSVSYFLVYDGTGKQELIETLRRERDAKAKQSVRVTTISIAGASVEKRVSGKSTSYETKAGNYYIYAGSQHAMGELLARFGGDPAPGAPFTQSANFPAACRELAQPSMLNVIVLPTQFHMPQPSSKPGFDFHAFSTSLHADRILAACMSVSFEKERLRTRGMVLGDTSQGSILNVFGNGLDSFATLSLASPRSSFQVSNIDFVALYDSLFNAVSAGLPSDKAPFLAAGVAFLTSTWGMPPDQFFASFTGEVAAIHPDTSVDPSQGLYALTIHDRDKILRVLQHGMLPGEQVHTNQEGDVTYINVTLPTHSVGGSAAAPAPATTYFALMPEMLLASKEQRLLRDGVARVQAGNGAGQAGELAGDPDFQKARASLPAKLVSLSYVNYAHFNWQKLFSVLEKNLNEQRQTAARNTQKPAPPRIDLLQGFDPAVLSRYLHVSIGGTWRDSNGIYLDSYIQ
jgi:hypothetical protein